MRLANASDFPDPNRQPEPSPLRQRLIGLATLAVAAVAGTATGLVTRDVTAAAEMTTAVIAAGAIIVQA